MIQGRSTIKALALEGAMRPLWEERHATNIGNAITRGGRTDAYTNLGQTLTQSTSLMMTSFGALAIIGQELTMGSLIATNMLSGRLLGPLNQLVSQWRTYSGYRQAVDRLGEIFAIESERMESEVKLDKPKGTMTAHNLSFAYAEGLPPVCDNVTVSFDAGGIHALVGRNGSGKTTLLKMLQGLYRPSNGRVLLDGADISQFSRAELARWMGYVPQESTLFAGTVRDNITNRYPDATDEEIITAAKASGVHDFIIDLPDGYGSDIGEAGRRLSGGQRQRIAIARALIGNPSVLMLDEPSSSLDRHAELELRDTLKELSKQHTVIIVTHSPILLSACDNLVALDKGKVALAGPAKDILPRLFGVAPAKSEGGPDSPKPLGEVPLSPPSPPGPATEKAPMPQAALGATPPAKPAPSPAPVKPVAVAKATLPKPGVKPSVKPGVKPGVKSAPKPAPKPVAKPTPKPVMESQPHDEPKAESMTEGPQAFAKIEPVKIPAPEQPAASDAVEDTVASTPAKPRAPEDESDDPYSDALQSLSTDRLDPPRQ
ncbi:MAG: ATP-binding cassette domain-containing protein [Rhodospirillales bacterium]|nr:ATP-binding cassette domain-containing protein [Rhodospirillales bacterium]